MQGSNSTGGMAPRVSSEARRVPRLPDAGILTRRRLNTPAPAVCPPSNRQATWRRRIEGDYRPDLDGVNLGVVALDAL